MTNPTMTETEKPNGRSGGAESSRHSAGGGTQKLSATLGTLRIGLGAGAIIAPRTISSWTGVPRRSGLIRAMGAQDIAAGVGMLTNKQTGGWLWARVGGDLLAMAALIGRLASRRSERRRTGVALAAVAGVTALDIACARQLGASQERSLRFSASTTLNRRLQECYQSWRDIESLPRIFAHLKSVRVIGEGRSHWIAKGPAGKELSWDAAITEDIPNEHIAWRSLPGAEFPNSGSVRFEGTRGGRCTIVRLHVVYELPIRASRSILGGILGRDPGFQLKKALLRFKQLQEAGEIATTEGQPSGRRSGATTLDRLARV